MSDALIEPELLASLPPSWQAAESGRRHPVIRDLPADPEQRALALSALEACLAFQVNSAARYGEDPTWGLPEAFFDDDWFLLQVRLMRRLPTLADVTRANVRDWLQEGDVAEILDVTWTEPSDEFIEAVGQMWATFIVNGLTLDLLRWLSWVARDHLDVVERARALDLLKAATRRLPWRHTIDTIPVILSLGGSDERDYFDQLANDPDLHEKARAEAASKRWLIDSERARA
ncbi:hypothetical protein [Micromonospora sp. NPDC005172]|uniref:hypothetical protein n=1 Tax=Micromonospora sp. NPDC005172 TaxID=3156867 RepID=UPI0033B4BACE